MKLKYHLKLIPFYLVLALILIGGGFLHFGEVKIEVGSVTAWAILALFIYLPFVFKPKSQIREALKSFYARFFIGNEKKKGVAYLVFFISLCFVAHVFKHWSFNTHGYDISFVYQSLFYPLGPPLLPADFAASGTALGEHLLFSLLLIIPITAFFKSDEILILIQHLSVFFALYLLIFKTFLRNKPQFWAYTSFFFLSFATLRSSLIWNFREDIFLFLGLALLVYCICSKYFWRSLFVVAFVLLTKENACLILPFLAIPLWFEKELDFQRSRILGLIIVILSAIYFIVGYKFLLPYFAQGKMTSPFLARFGTWGNSPSEVVINLLTSPPIWWDAFKRLMAPFNIKYYLALLLPTLIIVGKNKRALLWLIPGFMGILMNAITGYENQTSMSYHYDLIVLPFIFSSIMIALSSKPNIFDKRIFWALIFAIIFSGRWPGFYINKFFISTEDLTAQKMINNIDYPLIAGDKMSAQVNHLRKYYPTLKTSAEEAQELNLPILLSLDEKSSKDFYKKLDLSSYRSKLLHEEEEIILLIPESLNSVPR